MDWKWQVKELQEKKSMDWKTTTQIIIMNAKKDY